MADNRGRHDAIQKYSRRQASRGRVSRPSHSILKATKIAVGASRMNRADQRQANTRIAQLGAVGQDIRNRAASPGGVTGQLRAGTPTRLPRSALHSEVRAADKSTLRQQNTRMPRSSLMSEIRAFDRSSLNPVEANRQLTPRQHKALALSEIRNFGAATRQGLRQVSTTPNMPPGEVIRGQGGNLEQTQLLQAEQRYIVSPHQHTKNLFGNAYGMSTYAQGRQLPGVRPVFKDNKQRRAFSKRVHDELKKPNLSSEQTSALDQLRGWSSKNSALSDFSFHDKRARAPVVYVQGHGSAGDTSIASDAHERRSATEVASLLHTRMGLPDAAQVRANSCYSATEKDLFKTEWTQDYNRRVSGIQAAGKGALLQNPDNRGIVSSHAMASASSTIERHQQRNEVYKLAHQKDAGPDGSYTRALQGKGTFAGALHSALREKGGHHTVVGYYGPTTQGATGNVQTKSPTQNTPVAKRSMAAITGIGPGRTYGKAYKRGDFKSVIAPVPQSNREIISNAIRARRPAVTGGEHD